ncbi:MAG: hypothetical protein COB24_14285 [Hyphomicrobiales bacterium]|nr:MAG: hypothetical protein COB24_14285 [Hyphomicrobiales bacterium]
MVGRPQKRTIETRRNILNAAEKLFDKNGFENTSMEEIARKASVVKGTIFSHFGDKTSLLIAIKLKFLVNLIEAQKLSLENNDTSNLTERLMKLYRPWLKIFRENPDFAHLFLVQSTLKSGVWTDEFVQLCGGFEQIISDTLQENITDKSKASLAQIELSTQAMQAFYYHVLALYKGGYIKSSSVQEGLLNDLISKWWVN